MLSPYKIWTVARFEIKLLLRSWFFRIFAGLALAILTFFNIGIFADAFGGNPWSLRGIPGALPYFNLMILNVAQAIVVSFLATDFLKRDKNLSATEVVYMRSMTNGDYVFGKVLGVSIVFIGFDIFLLLIGGIINAFFTDFAFQIVNYGLYLVLITIPTLIFTIGFALLLMNIVRNQALVLVILLGYIAGTLFLINVKFFAFYDMVCFFLPVAVSDFVGLGDAAPVIAQRIFYASLGLSFLFVSILFLKRLPQSKGLGSILITLSAIFMVVSVFSAKQFHSYYGKKASLRSEMIELNDQLAGSAFASMKKCDIQLTHKGESIEAQAQVVVKNENSEPLDKLVFSFNPELKISNIKIADVDAKFSQNVHIVTVDLAKNLSPSDELSIFVNYAGSINDDVAFLDATEEDLKKFNNIELYRVGKDHSFLTDDYVLLIPSSLWYPVMGVTYTSKDLWSQNVRDFTDFSLTVKTAENLLPVSQGKVDSVDNRTYKFSPEVALPGLSLVIGEFEKKSITVDSVDYQLYLKPDHNFFAEYVSEVGDTLGAVITETKNEFEAKLDMDYPYKRFMMVEAPLQFLAYNSLLSFSDETVQPEMVLLPEKGATLRSADFKRMKHWNQRRNNWRNQTESPREVQINAVNQFIRGTFLGDGFGRFGPDMGFAMSYLVFPNYYKFTNQIKSVDWPVFDFVLEAYWNSKIGNTDTSNPWMRFGSGLLDEEKANLELRDATLDEIVKDPEKAEIAKTVLSIKSQYLFNLLKMSVDAIKFDDFWLELMNDSKYGSLQLTDIENDIQKQLGFEINNILKNWSTVKGQPGFVIANFKNYKFTENDETRYQVLFDVSNNEKIDGLLKIDFRGGRGGGRGFRGGPPESIAEYSIAVKAGDNKRVGIVLDEEPGGISINMLTALNIPSTINERFEDFELNKKAKAFSGEVALETPVSAALPNEIVVDNEDDGFKIEKAETISPLKRFIMKFQTAEEEEFSSFNFWRPPNSWKKVASDNFYGKYIHSAHYMKGEIEGKDVSWTADIAQGGQYDIYTYFNADGLPGGRRFRDRFNGTYTYSIEHDDGSEQVSLAVEGAEEGWNYLGSYYLSQGPSKVTLFSNTDARIVVGDAIKWVKR